ncbi:MAG: S-adenosylmethionine:tRNA ribosyltransferase-isomerase [Lacunisphaera sp.]
MSALSTDLFDYPLPERLIAQQPTQRRDESRLLVVDRAKHTLAHRHFRNLPEYLKSGDTLFRNNAAVIPARLHAARPTGGQVECLLLRPAISGQPSAFSLGLPNRQIQVSGFSLQASDEWWCLLRRAKSCPSAQRSASPAFSPARCSRKPRTVRYAWHLK